MAGEFTTQNPETERKAMLKALDDTHAGVKGLSDSGILKLPKIFIRPTHELSQDLVTHKTPQIQVPMIDLSRIHDPDLRPQIVEQVRVASETWGFFQVTNHGIPTDVLDGMIHGIEKFHDMDVEEKSRYYTRDYTRRVRYHCNHDLFSSKTANWRDTLSISFSDENDGEVDELPPSCRESTIEYSKHAIVLGNTLLEILSEGLGLKPDHLNSLECGNGVRLSCHYYPACPESELTLGATKHSDPGFLTILLQNQIAGLQVHYQDQWIDVHPIPTGLVINIGDLLQLVSNGRFMSNKHRVVAKPIGPRISVACFFSGPVKKTKVYKPIKELVSNENPAQYKGVLLTEYLLKFLHSGLDENFGLDFYKL